MIYLHNLDDDNIQSLYTYANGDKHAYILTASTDQSRSYAVDEVPVNKFTSDSSIDSSYHLVAAKR